MVLPARRVNGKAQVVRPIDATPCAFPFTRRAGNTIGEKGDDGLQWFEPRDLTLVGARFAGYADEIHDRINHKGWYADDYQGALYRGVVYLLPSRKGERRALVGYSDDNVPGSARLALYREPLYRGSCDPELVECALEAEATAEQCAEKEREYQAIFQIGAAIEDMNSEAWEALKDYADERAALRGLLRDEPGNAKEIEKARGHCEVYRERFRERAVPLAVHLEDEARHVDHCDAFKESCTAWEYRNAWRLDAAFTLCDPDNVPAWETGKEGSE